MGDGSFGPDRETEITGQEKGKKISTADTCEIQCLGINLLVIVLGTLFIDHLIHNANCGTKEKVVLGKAKEFVNV